MDNQNNGPLWTRPWFLLTLLFGWLFKKRNNKKQDRKQ